MKKTMLKILIGSLCISALLGIFIIIIGNSSDLADKILATSGAVFAFSIAGLCSATLFEKEKYKIFSRIGMLISLLSCIWLILMIWGILVFDASNFLVLITLVVLTYSSAHISLLLLIEKQNPIIVGVRNATILLSAILDFMIIGASWEWFDVNSFCSKLMAVLAILIALGTIVSPILNKVYKK